MKNLLRVYQALLSKHGPQGWWPLQGKYYPGEYHRPRNTNERFEVCVGAILTQNTLWKNVERSLEILRNADVLAPEKMLSVNEEQLGLLIKNSGYYRQKAKKLQEFARFYLKVRAVPKREELLAIWGIGPETADSILLYAYHKPYFVVDAYTLRLFREAGIDLGKYESWQEWFHQNLPQDSNLYKEFHALIVAEGKAMH